MRQKGRPKKYRMVKHDPRISQFSPRGRPGRPDEADLSMDEFEAIRLADFLKLSQKVASQSMRISQQTFSRILRRAHTTVADVLVLGKIIKIKGGTYVFSTRQNLPDNQQNEKDNRPERS